MNFNIDSLFGFQPAFVTLGGDYVIFLAHGGRNSGKTFSGATKSMVYGVNYPGARIIVTAPNYKVLSVDATLPVFREVLVSNGLLERKHWEFNKTDHTLTLMNGTQYIFRSTDNPESLRGAGIAAFWMDEGSRSPQRAFENLLLSLRQGREKGGGGKYPLMGWITTTPAGKLHWLYDAFFTSQNNKFKYYTFAASTRDNPYGGEELYEASIGNRPLEELTPFELQEFFGLFTVAEGLVYPEFNPHLHIVPEVEWPTEPKFVMAGIDFGWTAPSAIVVEGYTPIDDSRGYRFLLDEVYKPKCSEDELARYCKSLMAKYNVRLFPCDDADQRFIWSLRQHGVPAFGVKKRNTVVYRKALCSRALQSRDEYGNQLFFASPNMVNWRVEIENYTERPQKERLNPDERPISKDNHAMDGWEYVEMEIARQFTTGNYARSLGMRL